MSGAEKHPGIDDTEQSYLLFPYLYHRVIESGDILAALLFGLLGGDFCIHAAKVNDTDYTLKDINKPKWNCDYKIVKDIQKELQPQGSELNLF